VNGLQIDNYDSNTKKYEPKQEWMKKITEEDHEYWVRETQKYLNSEQVHKVNTDITCHNNYNIHSSFNILNMSHNHFILNISHMLLYLNSLDLFILSDLQL
uniref:MHC class I-like antigen recognition-like domain-containing protein n=1 Tax=Neogobius melanostomus TaxID=47308 RepID=A0A8C6TL35_9GOBI